MKYKSTLLLVLFSIPFFSQALTLNLRGGYRSASHAYESLVQVSHGWSNGWWASFESNSWNKIHDNSNEFLALNYSKIDINKTYKLNDKWSLIPGIQTQWMSAGSQYNPYLKLSYQVNPDINLGIRYRYDWKAFRQTDLDGNSSRNNQHQIDGYFTYRINDTWLFAWQTTVYTKDNNFRYGNHKKTATENAFVVQYKFSPTITPYVEYDYLDKQGVYLGRDNLHENSYRIGVLINF
ncbi:TPA: oligogalacturonate-specific porin KdgM family protein [Escherichia coli]